MTPIYARTEDERGHAATQTCNEAADPYYPVTNAQTLNPADIFKTAAIPAGAVNIDRDHATDVNIPVFSLHHHNIPAGTDVRYQRSALSDYSVLDMDVPVTIAPYPQPGLPLPVAIDLTGESGFDSDGFRYSRLHIPALSQIVGVGSFLEWGAKRVDLTNMRHPITPVEQEPSRVFRTFTGVKRTYAVLTRVRAIRGEMLRDASNFAAFLALIRSAHGEARPFLWWMDPSGSDAWLSSFTSDTMAVNYEQYNTLRVDFSIEERSFGLSIPTV